MDPITINLQSNQALNYNLGYLISRWSGRLPAGLSLNFSTDSNGGGTFANITGTCSESAGSYMVTVYTLIGTTQIITFVVANPNPLDPPVISCEGAILANGVNTRSLGAGAISLQFSATNNGLNWQAALPYGLGNNGYGLVSGTLAPGNYTIVMQCQNYAWSLNDYNHGPTQTTTYILHLTVTAAIPVVSPGYNSLSGNYIIGDDLPNNAPFSVQDSAKPVTWSATGLPDGAAINPTTGVLTGKLTTTGTFNCTFTATNSAGSGSFSQVILIEQNQNIPAVSLAAEQPGSSGQAGYGQQTLSFDVGAPVRIYLNADHGPVTWSGSDFPAGLDIDEQTGMVSGILRAAGSYRFFTVATNNIGASIPFGVVVSATGQAQAFQFVSDDPSLTDVQIDVRTGDVSSSQPMAFKQLQRVRLALVFLDYAQPVAPPSADSVEISIRQKDQYDGDYLIPQPTCELVAAVDNHPAYLLAEFTVENDNINGAIADAIAAATSGSSPVVNAMVDISWQQGDIQRVSKTFSQTFAPSVFSTEN